MNISANPPYCFILLFIGSNQLVALAVDIDNLNLRVFLQVLTQLGDIHIH